MKSFVNSAGTPFHVRVVQKGDAYGRDDCLTHDEAEPMVEFYDASQDPEKFGPRGQFATRYYLSTLIKDPEHYSGLDLQGDVPSWFLDGQTLRAALAYAVGRIEGGENDRRP